MKLPDITTGEIKKAICQLANGKASDHLGMTAEHYKIGGKHRIQVYSWYTQQDKKYGNYTRNTKDCFTDTSS
jgi:hypothetical protein